jgi:translocation and assembly module TamA
LRDSRISRRSFSRSVAVALAVFVACSPAAAFELFGIKLWGSRQAEDADTIDDPHSYSVELTVTGGDRALERTVRDASTVWQDREEPASGAAGLLVKARGDYRRILATLYGEGRYGGAISIRIDGREAADLPPDAALPNPASIAISVDPGPLFHFGEARIVNQAPPPEHRKDEVDLPQDEGFAPGEVARSGTILKAERLAVEAWREQGHAKAEAADRRVVAAHEIDTIDATITIEPGRKAYYGPVGVEGTERMDPEFAAWMAGLPLGAEYDPDDLERANKRLARLDVFRALRLQEDDAIGPDGLLPISVIVQERPLRRFGVGGSFSTVDGLGLEAFWLHRNLFGRAERLRFDGRIAGIGRTIDPAKLNYRLAATFLKPGIYTPDTNFVASVVGEREVLEPYTRTGVIAETGLTHIFTDELSGRVLLNGGYATFEDKVFGARAFSHVGILGGLTYDSRDNAADATRGFYADLLLDPYYEFNYGNFAARVVAEGRAYYGFGEENRVVLAGRLKLGSLVGPPIAETAPDKLFFAGGGGSVRGYAYRSIGVPGPGNTVAGGRSLIEGSVELRTRITDTIGLVGFADAGYVGADSWPRFSEGLRVGVGAGLRYFTGFGPIRLDVALPLNRRPNDPSVAFYVGIGQAF